jgi:DMSO/TMAO reductase YedYZ molybdopterin-dependent catalytic subunit
MAKDRLPPDQHLVRDWPVLHYGSVPHTPLDQWDFRVFGLVERPVTLSYEAFRRLGSRDETVDIHCVTGWSRFDNRFTGVPTSVVLELARPLPEARYVMVHAENGFTTNLPLEDFLHPDALFAWAHDGKDLTPEHGWPLRLVVPHLYFWKSAKWVRGVELMAEDRAGFWEEAGYHMRGDPWQPNNRFRDDF